MNRLNKILITGEKVSAFFYAEKCCVCKFFNYFFIYSQTKNSLSAILHSFGCKIAQSGKHPMILFSGN